MSVEDLDNGIRALTQRASEGTEQLVASDRHRVMLVDLLQETGERLDEYLGRLGSLGARFASSQERAASIFAEAAAGATDLGGSAVQAADGFMAASEITAIDAETVQLLCGRAAAVYAGAIAFRVALQTARETLCAGFTSSAGSDAAQALEQAQEAIGQLAGISDAATS